MSAKRTGKTERVKVAEAAAKKRSIFAMNDPAASSEFEAVYKAIGSRIGI